MWIKAVEKPPAKSGYYQTCVLPANWQEIEPEEALSYLKSNHGRRFAWFHNNHFWEIDHPSRSSIIIDDIVVYWAELPEAPPDPVIEPYGPHDFFNPSSPQSERERTGWLTSVVKRYLPPGKLKCNPRDMTTRELAELLLKTISQWE